MRLGLRFSFALIFPKFASLLGSGGVARSRLIVRSNFDVSVMADFTSRADEEFFGAIGRLTISWAQIEAGLDFGIEIAHHAFGGKKIDPEPPKTALHRKLRYIRKWSKTISEPTFQRTIGQLMDDIEKAADRRHDLVHGFIIEHAEGSGEAEMIRIVHNEKPYGKKQYKVTTAEILRAAVAANKLASRTLHFGTGMQELVASLLEKRD